MKEIPVNFQYPTFSDTDFVFGSNQLQGEVLNLKKDWRNFVPPFESQNRNGVESSVCFIEGLQHTIATLLEKKYGILDQNFSARFNAIFSNATPSGGDPLRAAQSFRDKGLIPDTMLPFSDIIKSWDEFVSFLGGDREECEKQGKVWRSYWTPAYDIVVKREMDVKTKYEKLREALLYSPCPVSVAQGYDNGQPKPAGRQDIHLVELLYIDDKGYPTILDTYSPFIKTLAPFYNFDFGMRLSIEKNTEPEQLGIIQRIINLMASLIGILKTEKETPIAPVIVSPETIVEPSKYDWDTPVLARHSVRLICDEMGLTVTQKNELCGTVGAESYWNPKAVGKPNFDGTRDFGIVQLNEKYWIGTAKQFPSTDYVLNNPEACVRWMCKMWKAGHRNYWYGYKNKSYLKYM